MAAPLFSRYASPKTVLTLFLVMIAINVFFFSKTGQRVEGIPLDLKFSYTPAFVYSAFDAMPESEINQYKKALYTMDVLYPVVYTLFFTFALYLLYGSHTWPSIIPYFMMGFDLLENTGIIIMLNSFKGHNIDNIIRTTSLFTSLKWIVFIIIIVLLSNGLLRKFVYKKSR